MILSENRYPLFGIMQTATNWIERAASLRIMFRADTRRRHRSRRDLADDHPRRRLRLGDHRRLDGTAEERLGRYRSLRARHPRPDRRIAAWHRRRGGGLRS